MGCLSNLKGTSSKPKGKVVRVTAAGRARKITMLEMVSIELPVCSYPTYFLMCGCKCVFLFLFFFICSMFNFNCVNQYLVLYKSVYL